MNRGRVVTIAVGLAVAAGAVYALVDGLLLAPARQIERTTRGYREQVAKLKSADRELLHHRRYLRDIAEKGFGDDRDEVSLRMHSRLETLLIRSGLTKDSIRQLGASSRRGYVALSSQVSARGPLERVVDFLYLLRAQPYVQRVDGLNVKWIEGSPDVSVSLKYSTIIVRDERRRALESGFDEDANAVPPGVLESPQRERFAVVSRRNVFLPYLQRPTDPPPVARRDPDPPPRQPENDPPPARPRVDPLTRLRVSDLSKWGDKQDIRVENRVTGEQRVYHPGDRLAGGVIALVDVREMPLQDDPLLTSPSRVVLRIAGDYWAVELGQTLAQKRRLRSGQLPPGLTD
jgi:hypothetical protein